MSDGAATLDKLLQAVEHVKAATHDVAPAGGFGVRVKVIEDRLWPVETIGHWLPPIAPARQPRSRRRWKKLLHGTRRRRRLPEPMLRQVDPMVVSTGTVPGFATLPQTLYLSATQWERVKPVLRRASQPPPALFR